MKKRYGILAYPAKHSLSPVIHNKAFEHLDIDASYEVFEVDEKSLDSFMKKLRDGDICGVSVSLPYKEKILEYLDEIDDDALRIGAVNTIVKKDDGVLCGYNTDWIGAVEAIKEVYGSLEESISVVAGAGGAARATVYGLLKEGSHVWVQNRTREKADKMAIEFAELFESEIHSDDWEQQGTGDILVNATSIWHQKKDEMPYFCDPEYVECFDTVMDLSYTPLMTPLLRIAKNLGKKIVSGDRMLLFQAAKQFELWTCKKPPFEVMESALKNEGILHQTSR